MFLHINPYDYCPPCNWSLEYVDCKQKKGGLCPGYDTELHLVVKFEFW